MPTVLSPSQSHQLQLLLPAGEERLMERILHYAREQEYTKYTSTLSEAWRMSIQGLTTSLLQWLETGPQQIELHPDEIFRTNVAASFGVLEASRHRDRGISITMFLGLLKYYRHAYHDYVDTATLAADDARIVHRVMDRFFDRVELGFAEEWLLRSDESNLAGLQSKSRELTNEKNLYLTLFESIRLPALLLDDQDRIVTLNPAAVGLLGAVPEPGALYYREREPPSLGCDGEPAGDAHASPVGRPIGLTFPWLTPVLARLAAGEASFQSARVEAETAAGPSVLMVQLTRMADISGKYAGTVVIVDDVTSEAMAGVAREELIAELRTALRTVKTLKGLIPICAWCKKIRDDGGYWGQLETYLAENSDAQLSHGICPECAVALDAH